MSKKLGSNIQKIGAREEYKKEKEKAKHTQDTQTQTQKPTVCRKLIPKIKKTVSGQTLIPLEELLRDRWYIKEECTGAQKEENKVALGWDL
ncbi:hypothetical protein Y032_0131g1670 [Ancylostoma ceylanicum]|uniref:Uncharacterized protein n=1 Tax=Ancylostoma ceylanicum TaxID=53326 RepID=A0A016T795_9BILA|nr:hypothetical protein Y032_0131g1670 [Ancylostoma ceylanicum]